MNNLLSFPIPTPRRGHRDVFTPLQRFNFLLFTFYFLLPGLPLSAQSYTSFFTGSPLDAAATPAGGVCMMGGATESDDAMRWFLQRAGGGDVLVLRASGSNGYNNYLYSELGVSVNSVETIVFNQAAAAFDPYVRQRIMRAEAIWFAGGDQWRYVSFWRNTPVDSLINEAVRNRNIVIGGTSAGMAILGGVYFTAQNGTVSSAQALSNPYHVRMTIDSARFLQIPYMGAVVTDTHYDNPDRKGRHVAFMARAFTDWGIEARGIACDEYTAVCIDPEGNAVVFGGFPAFDDNAYFIQVNCALSERLPENCTPGNPLDWNRNGQALKVYKVKGTTTGSNRFNVSDWQTGAGGVWENWYVDAGALLESPGDPIDCQPSTSYSFSGKPRDLSIYPNPGSDRLYIRHAGQVDIVQILDMQGREATIVQATGPNLVEVNTAFIPTGIYLVRIQTKAGAYMERWIKCQAR